VAAPQEVLDVQALLTSLIEALGGCHARRGQ